MGLTPEQVAFFRENGYLLVQHGHILHSSFPNLSDRRRRGYATHYVSACCRYTGPDPTAEFPLARGQSHPGRL
jgi:hypothetical protein